jgi:hypothetical protein
LSPGARRFVSTHIRSDFRNAKPQTQQTTGKTTTTSKRGGAVLPMAGRRPRIEPARSTAGDSAHADAAAAGDAAFVRGDQALAAKMLFNANKPHEHGKLARTPGRRCERACGSIGRRQHADGDACVGQAWRRRTAFRRESGNGLLDRVRGFRRPGATTNQASQSATTRTSLKADRAG